MQLEDLYAGFSIDCFVFAILTTFTKKIEAYLNRAEPAMETTGCSTLDTCTVVDGL